MFALYSKARTDFPRLKVGDAVSLVAEREKSRAACAIFRAKRRLISASLDGIAQIWDSETREPIGPPMNHPADLRSVAINPDGSLILTGCEDGLARLWDARTQQPKGITFEHQQAVSSVAISADGRLAVSASHDRIARVWDMRTGQPVGGPLQHPGPVLWVEFSPNGEELATACTDRVARIWQIQSAVAESAAEVARWAELATGMTLGEDGVARYLSATQWRQRRFHLKDLQDNVPSGK